MYLLDAFKNQLINLLWQMFSFKNASIVLKKIQN